MKYWKVSQVAEYLGVTTQTVKQIDDLSPIFTPGGHRRYDPMKVMRYRDASQVKHSERRNARVAAKADAEKGEGSEPDEVRDQ